MAAHGTTSGMSTSTETSPGGEKMRAVTFSSFRTSALAVREVPKPPAPGPDEIRIRVRAAGLNPADKLRVEGSLRSIVQENSNTDLRILGYDCAGEVSDVGPGVTLFKVGDRVASRLVEAKWGALAEYVTVNMNYVAKIPDEMEFVDAAAIPLVGQTALQMCYRAKVDASSRVFITRGAGGVGSFLIGLCKNHFKAAFVATTASAGVGMDIAKSCGADLVIDHKTCDFTNIATKEYDVLFDTTKESIDLAHIAVPGARIVSIAEIPQADEIFARENPSFLTKLWYRPVSYFGNISVVNAAKNAGAFYSYLYVNPNSKDLEACIRAVMNGEVKIVLDTVADSMEDFKKAVDKLFSDHAKGKCIIKIQPSSTGSNVAQTTKKVVLVTDVPVTTTTTSQSKSKQTHESSDPSVMDKLKSAVGIKPTTETSNDWNQGTTQAQKTGTVTTNPDNSTLQEKLEKIRVSDVKSTTTGSTISEPSSTSATTYYDIKGSAPSTMSSENEKQTSNTKVSTNPDTTRMMQNPITQ